MVLAAGSGRRYGGPKALVDTGSGPWVLHALDVLASCSTTIVVVGASADAVAALVVGRSTVAVNPEHDAGMASSLRVGLGAVPGDVDAVLVMLVDLPGVTAAVPDRLVVEAGPRPHGSLIRAAYGGVPGHPVLIGIDHLDALRQSLARGEPDAGGSRYLAANGVRSIECGDLADGADVDRPAGPGQSGPGQSGPDRSGPDRSGPDPSGPDQSGPGRYGRGPGAGTTEVTGSPQSAAVRRIGPAD